MTPTSVAILTIAKRGEIKMRKFYIDFSGYLKVEANTPREAEEKFWRLVNSQFNLTGDYSDDVWDIDGIEEISDN